MNPKTIIRLAPPSGRVRRFAPLALAPLCALHSATTAAPDATPTRATPPNIVFIFSDDHAWQAVSCYGESRRLLETPNIDRIARNGMRFDRCLVSNAVCGPSRACVLTGAYSHVNGFYNNSNCVFDGSQPTFPKLLRAAGYQTAIVGKWHLHSDPTGFDFWQILPGQGVYYNPVMIRNGSRMKTEGYVTDIITDASLDWLKTRDKTRPFLLMTQHKAPHRQWEPAPRHLNHDNDRAYPEPPTLFDDYSGRGPAERAQEMSIAKNMNRNDLKLAPRPNLPENVLPAWDSYYKPRNDAFAKAALSGQALTRWKYQRYMHDYLATIRGIDEGVGRLLDYLEEAGLMENTIVVYSSDQGFFLGEHGWFDKRWIYEESLRAPLVVSWPGVIKPGSVSRDIVSNIDFAQTFLDAAGVPAHGRMQGRSFVPLLRGRRPSDWRASFYYEYYEYPAPHRVPPHYGVITDRHKLFHVGGPDYDYWEMFDLKTDPREMKNIIDVPEYSDVRKTLEIELSRLRKELQVPDQTPAHWRG